MQHRNLRGSDLHAPSNELVENDGSGTINATTVITYSGIGLLGYPSIINISSPTTQVIRGITQSAISNVSGNNTGYVCSLGFLVGTAQQPINTNAWTVGTLLFSDTSGNLSSTPAGLPICSVLKQDATLGVLYVNAIGVMKEDLDNLEFPDALSLELAWDINYTSFYTEPTYNLDGSIASSSVWDSPSKTVLIFTKAYTYTSGQLTKVLVTRVPDGQTLEKDIVYNLDGSLKNVTRIYTP